MKRTATTVLLVSLLAGSTAMAGSPRHRTSDFERDMRYVRPDGGERRTARDPQLAFRSVDRRWHDARYRDNFRVYNGYVAARTRYPGGHYQIPRGYYRQVWVRGDRLPVAYCARPYVVYEYRDYRLYDPPRGYRWVRVNNDVVLTALATGFVLDAVYNLYY